jgi:hypothetical protein
MVILQKFICVTFVVLACALSSSAQTTEKQSDKEIKVCRIELTEVGKRACFHFNFIFLVKTDDKGVVEKIEKIHPQKSQPFVREDKFVECVKTWKLDENEKYTVGLSFGTTSHEDSISILDSKSQVIRLILN